MGRKRYSAEQIIRLLRQAWEWENERELGLELNKWVEYYNKNYLHSAHGCRTPIQPEEEYYKNCASHKNAA